MTTEDPYFSKRICVFVSSSDRTRDVFLRVYAHFGRMWPASDYSRFVGFTTGTVGDQVAGFSVVPSAGKSDWARELADQLLSLPRQFEFVLLLLDDFLVLEPVEQCEIEEILRQAVEHDFSYLRLKPPDRSWIVATLRHSLAKLESRKFHRLSVKEPYYSSLQAALWKREHLLACLAKADSIWHFEHLVPVNVAHWTVTRPVLLYRHTVEKSRWQAYTPSLFRRLGLTFHPGDRPIHSSNQLLSFVWTKTKFALIGFGWVRFKRAFFAREASNAPRDHIDS